MRKIRIFVALALCALLANSCDLFKLDNYDGPDAQIEGRLLDSKTGEKVGVEASYSQEVDWNNVDWTNWVFPMIISSKGTLLVNELGWKDNDGNEVVEDQRWFVRFDGHYRNDLVFAATYRVIMKELPCYEISDDEFTVNKGANKKDFEVTPFCRILEPSVTYNETTKKFEAKFKVELGDPAKANTIQNVMFCANTQLFVGANYFNLAKDDALAKKSTGLAENTEITLQIDPADPKNAELFKYNRTRYFRIGAQAGGNDYNGNALYNFSPIYEVSADFQTITEHVWSE